MLAIWSYRITVVTDPTSGRILKDVGIDGWDGDVPPSEGVKVGECRLSTSQWRLCADDLKTGRPLWRARLPLDRPDADEADFSAATDHGRVYTLTKDPTGPWKVSAYDLRTGTMVDQVPLPPSPKSTTSPARRLLDATNGILAIRTPDSAFNLVT